MPQGSGGRIRIRKLQHKWTDKQTRRLIEEVHMREGTWNIYCNKYKDRTLRYALWQEIANAMKLPRAEVASKWNSLRCSFRATYSKVVAAKYDKKRIFSPKPLYTAMQFLESVFQSDPLNGTAASTSQMSIGIPILTPTTTPSVATTPTPATTPSASPLPTTMTSSAAITNPIPDNSAEFVRAFLNGTPIQPFATTQPNGTIKPVTMLQIEKDERRDDHAKTSAHATTTRTPLICSSGFWQNVGNFVAVNGREWEKAHPKLANEYKRDIYEVVFKYQQKYAEWM